MFARFLRNLIELAFWSVVAVVAMFAVALAAAFGLGPAFAYLSPPIVILLLAVTVRVVRAIRHRHGMMVLTYLEQAARLNLPLPRMLAAAQQAEPRRLRERLGRLRQFLEEGYPIGDALDEAVPEIPRRAVAIAGAAERVGQLPQALGRLLAEERARAGADGSAMPFYHAYPVMMLVMVVGVLGMILVFIIPKFEQIFRDFGLPLPPVTRFVVEVGRDFGPLVLLVGVALLIGYLGRWLWDITHPRRPLELRFLGRLVWYLPVAHGVARDRGLADACELLADALAAGSPADRALNEAASLRTNVVLRGRLEEWADLVASGVPLADAARSAGMPALLVGMLATARASDDAADVFAFLGRYYRARFSRTATLLEAAVVPAVSIGFGLVVGLICMGLFVPLVRLADQVMLFTGLM
jgi:type II secretory pathway component PulF